jgi:hypothetical protein
MNLKLDRVHRFHIGEIIRHVDAVANDPANWITVEALTLRVVGGIAYPTYTISAKTYGMKETIPDVLDTEDLRPVMPTEPEVAQCPHCKAPFTISGVDHVVDCPATRHD